MNLAERLSRFIIAVIMVPFILVIFAFIIAALIALSICMLFFPLVVLMKPEILEIK